MWQRWLRKEGKKEEKEEALCRNTSVFVMRRG
jgi:hypothetical protein